ncbi:MAG: HAD-IA family hydrolase [Propionibacteriaceae bacterium]|jgi:pyrophosphatase PpaX|nr:HAD-IA family hydrolase [Propionibacteriaceae bacterium]
MPAVLFDLDGTLADSIDLILSSYDHAVFTVLGRHPNLEHMRGYIGRSLRDTFDELDPEHADELIAAYTEHNMANTAMIKPFPGVNEMLRDLRAAGYKTGIVTSKRRESAEATMRQVGLDGLIELVVTPEDTDAHKPDPEPLLKGAAKLGVEPARTCGKSVTWDCAYVGDAVVDVLAAKAARMRAVAMPWGAASEAELLEAGPDAIAHSAEELEAVLTSR